MCQKGIVFMFTNINSGFFRNLHDSQLPLFLIKGLYIINDTREVNQY